MTQLRVDRTLKLSFSPLLHRPSSVHGGQRGESIPPGRDGLPLRRDLGPFTETDVSIVLTHDRHRGLTVRQLLDLNRRAIGSPHGLKDAYAHVEVST